VALPSLSLHPTPKQGVCCTMALPFTIYIYIYIYIKAKEELWKLKYFHHAKNINLQKNPL
jgi:hypothetical protein